MRVYDIIRGRAISIYGTMRGAAMRLYDIMRGRAIRVCGIMMRKVIREWEGHRSIWHHKGEGLAGTITAIISI